jgi:hypothetical protein
MERVRFVDTVVPSVVVLVAGDYTELVLWD